MINLDFDLSILKLFLIMISIHELQDFIQQQHLNMECFRQRLFFFHSFGRTIWDKLLEFTFEIDEGEFKSFKTFGYWLITAGQQALCTETNIF